MAELTAVQRAGRWHVLRRDTTGTAPATPCSGSEGYHAAGRAAVWRAAQLLNAHSSPWDLEYLKACLGEPETLLGLAEKMATDCALQHTGGHAQGEVTLRAPARHLNLRTVIHAFAERGLAVRGLQWQAMLDRMRFLAASVGACCALLPYLIRYSPHHPLTAVRDGVLLAVHAEWSNRTRHVLTQLSDDFPVDAIILLGRLRASPDDVLQDWSGRLGLTLPPAFIPVSVGAALRAVPRMLHLLRLGLQSCLRQAYLPGLRAHTAIVFRVLLGAVMQQWWKESGFRGGTIVYGHTGTADTTLLEAAQKASGAKTLHVVHGIATGPNFLGFSDIAVFRCGHDALLYGKLQQYGQCIAPPAPVPIPRRGESGILLLTNFAHPLNPGYVARGLDDEIRVLREVAAIASEIGPQASPLWWKPHPALSMLPAPVRAQLAEAAESLGYEQLCDDPALGSTAAQVRWILTTPSTMALDLLTEGYLGIVLDWQASVEQSHTDKLLHVVANQAELREVLTRLELENGYGDYFRAAWSMQMPAQALDLGKLIKGLQ